MIARHGIDAALLAATGATYDEIGSRRIEVEQPYARDKAHLLTCVADPLRCQTVHTQGGDGPYVVRVYGFVSDLERVELLYTSLLLQAARDLVRVRPESWWGESVAAYRRSWLEGFASAVYTRLRRAEQRATAEQPATTTGTSTALVLQDRSAQVAAFVSDAHPRLRSLRTRKLSGGGRTDGYQSGTRADLGARQVGHARALPR